MAPSSFAYADPYTQNNGWEPEALVNFVALMGASWRNALDSQGAKQGEVLTMEQLIENVGNSEPLNAALWLMIRR